MFHGTRLLTAYQRKAIRRISEDETPSFRTHALAVAGESREAADFSSVGGSMNKTAQMRERLVYLEGKNAALLRALQRLERQHLTDLTGERCDLCNRVVTMAGHSEYCVFAPLNDQYER